MRRYFQSHGRMAGRVRSPGTSRMGSVGHARHRGSLPMMPTNRRTFLGAAGVLALSGRLASAAPSERVRVAVIGVRGRGADLARSLRRDRGCRGRRASATSTTRRSPSRSRRSRRSRGRRPGPRRTSAACSTTRTIDAIAVATPDHWHALIDRHGLPGGQGRLRREAGQPQRGRGASDGRGGPEVRPGRPVRHPAAEHGVRPGRRRPRPIRGARRGGDGPRLDPPGTARPSARASPDRSPRASTTPCGKGPPPTARS